MAVKLSILGMVFYLTWHSFYNWNWFKSAASVNCSDNNPQINEFILTPYTSLYLSILQYGIAKVICCFTYLIIDIVHFIYICKK